MLSTESRSEPPLHIDQQVDLLEYLRALLRHKYRILIAATLGASLVFAISYLFESRYVAGVLVAININEQPGGVDPKSYRTSDTLGLLEHDFIIDAANSHENEKDRMLATMQSVRFTDSFIGQQNLMPYLFREVWDQEAGQWRDNFVPDIREAAIAFNGIRGFDLDDDTGLLSVFFTTNNPELSADLANAYIGAFNVYMKNKQSEVIQKRRDYLYRRLEEIDNIELHKSIFRMIETQLGAESLLHAREDYPLEIIQPALPPLFKASPKRKQWAALTFLGLLFLGFMTSVGSVILGKLLAGLKAYNLTLEADTNTAMARLDSEKNDPYAGDEWDNGQ